jgi:sodium-dependent phosphate cotransporter
MVLIGPQVLQSALKGSMATLLRKALNMEFSGALAWLSDWLLIVVGCIITILVQSSSITTSTLTPLVGMGVLRLEKMYPVTLGANVGTTGTLQGSS